MHKTDWMYEAGWGVFNHYLDGLYGGDWNACVDSFDTERLAKTLAELGAGYYFITIMQRSKHLIAPNAAFNRITGYKPGEACANRDLIADLYDSLSKYGIRLCLYFTGDGPLDDPQAGPAMGYTTQDEPVTTEFVRNWASVLREYSERYGDKVWAWWVDGCYQFIGYDEEKLGMLADAAHAGNPDALVSLNCGVMERVSAYSDHDDFTTGEMNRFVDLPDGRFAGGAQWHELVHLGHDWAKDDTQIDGASLAKYVRAVNDRGGVITVEIAVTSDGRFSDAQMEVLSHLKDR